MASVPDTTDMSAEAAPIDHYENFPVASWLCPPALRPPIAAIYHFARTADDIADEGDSSAQRRLEMLEAYQRDLAALYENDSGSALKSAQASEWAQVFVPLLAQILRHDLPHGLLNDLLLAFMQDVRMTEYGTVYAEHAQVLDYCTRSANPVGRLLLHLYGVQDEASLAQSDAVCTALQLINFWQDLSVDIPRARYYVSDEVRAQFDVQLLDMFGQQDTNAMRNAVYGLMNQARHLMERGKPLPATIGGRAGWELRFVIQGALRVADKIENRSCGTINRRPKLHWWDFPIIAWRAVSMRLVHG